MYVALWGPVKSELWTFKYTIVTIVFQVDLISYFESILLNDPYNFLTSWPRWNHHSSPFVLCFHNPALKKYSLTLLVSLSSSSFSSSPNHHSIDVSVIFFFIVFTTSIMMSDGSKPSSKSPTKGSRHWQWALDLQYKSLLCCTQWFPHTQTQCFTL